MVQERSEKKRKNGTRVNLKKGEVDGLGEGVKLARVYFWEEKRRLRVFSILGGNMTLIIVMFSKHLPGGIIADDKPKYITKFQTKWRRNKFPNNFCVIQ